MRRLPALSEPQDKLTNHLSLLKGSAKVTKHQLDIQVTSETKSLKIETSDKNASMHMKRHLNLIHSLYIFTWQMDLLYVTDLVPFTVKL